jgi:hypothetical protein
MVPAWLAALHKLLICVCVFTQIAVSDCMRHAVRVHALNLFAPASEMLCPPAV